MFATSEAELLRVCTVRMLQCAAIPVAAVLVSQLPFIVSFCISSSNYPAVFVSGFVPYIIHAADHMVHVRICASYVRFLKHHLQHHILSPTLRDSSHVLPHTLLSITVFTWFLFCLISPVCPLVSSCFGLWVPSPIDVVVVNCHGLARYSYTHPHPHARCVLLRVLLGCGLTLCTP